MAYIDNPNGFFFDGMVGGGDTTPILSQVLNTAETVVHGDLLYVSGGMISIAAAAVTSLLGLCIEDVASSAALARIMYIPLLPDVIIVGQCSETPVQADMLCGHDIEGTTGIQELNEDDDSSPLLIPIDLWDRAEGFGANCRLRLVCNRSMWNISA